MNVYKKINMIGIHLKIQYVGRGWGHEKSKI